VIEANRRKDEKTSDVIRRALRLLDREAWEERARVDMHRLRTEDLSAEADAWQYDADRAGVRLQAGRCYSRPRHQDLDRSDPDY
jgi:Arc/MetJ-type ribon-helix-helix transcriptional regulator